MGSVLNGVSVCVATMVTPSLCVLLHRGRLQLWQLGGVCQRAHTNGISKKSLRYPCLQFPLTTATAAVFLYFECIRTFIQGSPVLILASMFGSIGLIFALTLHRHKHPLNLYLLCGFTLLESLTLASVVTFYDARIVMQAFMLTTAVFLALTTCTLQSKRDFSKLVTGLFAAFWILILSGVLRIKFKIELIKNI